MQSTRWWHQRHDQSLWRSLDDNFEESHSRYRPAQAATQRAMRYWQMGVGLRRTGKNSTTHWLPHAKLNHLRILWCYFEYDRLIQKHFFLIYGLSGVSSKCPFFHVLTAPLFAWSLSSSVSQIGHALIAPGSGVTLSLITFKIGSCKQKNKMSI